MAGLTRGKKGTSGVWKRYDRPSDTARVIILAVFAIILMLPIVGMLYFTFRSSTGGFTLAHWQELFSSDSSYTWMSLEGGLVNSIILVVFTVAIEFIVVVPALILIDVRYPHLRRPMRVFMLLPIAIPAIILVVGFAPVFSFLARVVGSGAWTLALAYGILAMPFVYTTLESDLTGLDAATLTQAAESLGASWWRALMSVLLPCLRRSLVSSVLITSAIVLGEYTIASLLSRETLQTDLVVISQSDVYISVIITLIVLLLTFVALFWVSGVGRRGHGNHQEGA